MFRCCAHYTLVAERISTEAIPYPLRHPPPEYPTSATMGKSRDPEVVKRTLRIQRAVFRKKTATLADIFKKRRLECKKAKATVRRLEAKIKELGGELSDEVSSCDALLGEVPVLTKKVVKAKPVATADPAPNHRGKPDAVFVPGALRLLPMAECVMLPPNVRLSNNTRVFLKLRKALYGLRSASLAWYKHLNELVKELGLHASDTEKSVFSGEYEFKGKKDWMLLLAYVDDLMIACKDREAALNLVERLGRSVKIKVTGILSRDKKIDFLGRVIQKIEYGLLLGLPEGYFGSVYESYGIKKGATTPADLRKILDDALEKPECQKPLTAEAVGS
ncbi:TY4B-J [Symbiodinium microadriaticum]|nr:TY4B-J [Symbiodinium microadriaticum]